jgi:hypothetical protein
MLGFASPPQKKERKHEQLKNKANNNKAHPTHIKTILKE